MDGSAFRGLGEAIVALFWVAVLAVPLAIWKLVDIAIWIAGHVSVGWSP